MMTFSGLKYSSPWSFLRGDGCLLILCVPQHTAGLLLIVAARLILFFISSHRHTRKQQVVSASYIFHGRQPQARKSKAQCHHPGIQEIPESLSFITKIICEHKQMWSTNMPFNWEGRWSHRGRDGSEKALWKTKHPQRPRPSICAASTGRQGLGLEATRLKQKSPLLPQRDTQTGQFTGTSCIGFPEGMLFIHFIIDVVFVFCCSFDSFGNEATSTVTWICPMRWDIRGKGRLKHNIYTEINTLEVICRVIVMQMLISR